MSFQNDPGMIRWRMHFRTSKQGVFEALTTDEGRARYWAESTTEVDGEITFHILGYAPSSGRILCQQPNSKFSLEYFGTKVEFQLADDAAGGTDLTLIASGVDEPIRMEMAAGWVSVLMAMKASIDHGVDLRNHDPERTWQQGFADN